MSLIERLGLPTLGNGQQQTTLEQLGAIPPSVKVRLERGRRDMMRDAPKRRLCVRFESGETYWFIGAKGTLQQQSTVTDLTSRDGKPPQRVRNKYNFIRPIITAKVSASAQRTPAFEVIPSTLDPQRVGAAELSSRVALYGYDKWRLQDVDVRCSYNAIGGGGEGFALPYFDPNVGPYRPVPVTDPATGEPVLDEATGQPKVEMVGEGEVKVIVLGGNEVYWEPGCNFMESRWHAVERARPVEDIEELPGFFGKPLKADAATSDIPTDTRPENMVMVTEYFERPCPRYPAGRHLVIANGRQVVPERKYPLCNKAGDAIDEPVLHRLAWDLDGGARRDFGLTWQLIDAQRTAQDTRNKAVEWKNRCLIPQWWVRANTTPPNQRLTDEPGAQFVYQGEQPPTQIQTQPIPDSLFRLADLAARDMQQMGFDNAIEASPDVAARTVQAVVEQSQQQWAQFLLGKAEWWSRLMRHCLLLVVNHYSEERKLKYQGRDGWEHIQDFDAASMMDEVDVRVKPASLVTLTRAQVRDMLDWIVTRFPNWLNPQDALAALETGSLDRIMASYWLDLARVNTVIQKIRDGTVMEMPPRGDTDPLTGQPILDPQTGQPMPYPGYLPDDQDNLQIWERVFSDWMKTDDYGRQDQQAQGIARQIWNAIQQLQTAQAQRQAAQTDALAQQIGSENAAKPAQPKPLPSMPGTNTLQQQQ